MGGGCAGEALDTILLESSGAQAGPEGEQGSGQGLFGQIQATVTGLQRFMRQLQS